MSKETTLIILGLLIMSLRTLLGFPGPVQTAVLIFAGAAVAIIGFLLRGESLARQQRHNHTSFVETSAQDAPALLAHDHIKEGINSRN